MMQLIDPKLDAELCEFICGWHELEKRGGHDNVIEMPLSDNVTGKKYKYRFDVFKDIERFLKIEEIKNHPHIFSKMTAHKYYIQKLMNAVLPFDEYLENTMGFKPIIYSDKKIAALRENANELLDPFNLKIKPNVRNALDRKDTKIIYKDYPIVFSDHYNALYNEINKKTGVSADFNVNYKQIDKDIRTIAEIDSVGKDYEVTFNMHHMKKTGVAGLKYLATHELGGHAIHFSNLRKNYEVGMMPRYMTYITIHEPFLYVAEGLALTVQDFFPEKFQDPLMQAIYSIDRMERAAKNNAAVMANRGESFADCVYYMRDNCPTLPTSRIAHGLSSFVNDPKGSSYYIAYSPALESFKQIAKIHTDKNASITSAYTNYLLPSDIMAQTKCSIIDFV